jgi:hypothetical protein
VIESALHALARRLRQARLHEYISLLAGDDVDQPGLAVLYVLNGEQELHGPEASLRITDAAARHAPRRLARRRLPRVRTADSPVHRRHYAATTGT